MQSTSLEETLATVRAVGPFESATVQKIRDAFFNAAQRGDIEFGMWEHMGTYSDPSGGVILGWYYRDKKGREYNDSLYMSYGVQLGRGYDIDLAMQHAMVLGRQAKFTMDLVEHPIARFKFLAPRRARRLWKETKIVMLVLAMLPLYATLYVVGKSEAADEPHRVVE